MCVTEREYPKSTLSKFLIYNTVLYKVIMLYITFLDLLTLHNCNFIRAHLFWDTTESLADQLLSCIVNLAHHKFPHRGPPSPPKHLSFLPQTKELFVHPTARRECQIYFGKPRFSPFLLLPLFISSSFLIPHPFICSVHSSSLSYHSLGSAKVPDLYLLISTTQWGRYSEFTKRKQARRSYKAWRSWEIATEPRWKCHSDSEVNTTSHCLSDTWGF